MHEREKKAWRELWLEAMRKNDLNGCLKIIRAMPRPRKRATTAMREAAIAETERTRPFRRERPGPAKN
jgi:hypothetical protein